MISRQRKWVWIVSLIAASLAPRFTSVQAAEPTKPNIVWIWSDNLGYGDLGCYGNTNIKTPHIDRLADQGVRLTQYYIAHAVCSPSRVAFITGRQPFRSGFASVIWPDSPVGLPEDEITMAEILREQGYATGCIGKWHMGDRYSSLPLQNGFDRYFGIPYSMDMLPRHVYRDNEILGELRGEKLATITEQFTDEAIRFVEENKKKPFFLYFSHTLPHPPIVLPERCRTPGRPIYYDALEHMDEQVGRLLEALEKKGLTNNTLVILTSDNGPWQKPGSAGGLRGGIISNHEGGLRVPFIASWPGKIPAGKTVDTPSIVYDMFPTFVHLAGGTMPTDRVYDGQDVWPLLTGNGEIKREKPFIWVGRFSGRNVSAVRDGRWKLQIFELGPDEPKTGRWFMNENGKTFKLELYDLEKDEQESQDVAELYPDVVLNLRKVADELQADIPFMWNVPYIVRDPAKLKSGAQKYLSPGKE